MNENLTAAPCAVCLSPADQCRCESTPLFRVHKSPVKLGRVLSIGGFEVRFADRREMGVDVEIWAADKSVKVVAR